MPSPSLAKRQMSLRLATALNKLAKSVTTLFRRKRTRSSPRRRMWANLTRSNGSRSSRLRHPRSGKSRQRKRKMLESSRSALLRLPLLLGSQRQIRQWMRPLLMCASITSVRTSWRRLIRRKRSMSSRSSPKNALSHRISPASQQDRRTRVRLPSCNQRGSRKRCKNSSNV